MEDDEKEKEDQNDSDPQNNSNNNNGNELLFWIEGIKNHDKSKPFFISDLAP